MLYARSVRNGGREGGPGDFVKRPVSPRRPSSSTSIWWHGRAALMIPLHPRDGPPGETLEADSMPASFASRQGRPERTLS